MIWQKKKEPKRMELLTSWTKDYIIYYEKTNQRSNGHSARGMC